jgi:hypothetical protein
MRESAKTLERIVGDMTEIRTKHLPNTNKERYNYTSPFGTALGRD